MLFQTDLEELPTFGVELPVLFLLIAVTAASAAGTVGLVIVGSRAVGTVKRLAFPRGVPPSTAGSSTFTDEMLVAAQRRAYGARDVIAESDYRQIWVARVQPIRPEVLVYRSAFELMARGIAAKLVVQAIGDDSVPNVLDPLAPMFVYTTKSLAPSLDSMKTIKEFLRDVPDRAGSFLHTPVAPTRYAHFLFVSKRDTKRVFEVLRDLKVALVASAHPAEACWEEMA